MNSTETSTAETAAANDKNATIVLASPAMVLRCLFVSLDQQNMDVIEAAASGEGWSVHRCVSVVEAMKLAFRKQFHLALVDTESVANSPLQLEFEELASDLARNHVPLLVISGNNNDPLSEIHARQLGVWLYLPGFDGRTELDVVFREARAVHQKMAGDTTSAKPRGEPLSGFG